LLLPWPQWGVSVGQQQSGGPPQLKLVHVRTLRMADEVLCVKASPDSRLLAVSLLDSTVKV
jgi:U3 small nucleolar RNA-associated protein 12